MVVIVISVNNPLITIMLNYCKVLAMLVIWGIGDISNLLVLDGTALNLFGFLLVCFIAGSLDRNQELNLG